MTHLSDEQLVDAAEGALDAPSLAHASTCAACAERVGATQRVLREVSAADVPEPSPLFWESLAARVNAAIDQPEAANTRSWIVPAWRWVSAAAVVTILVLGFQRAWNDPAPPVESTEASSQQGSAPDPDSSATLDAADIEADEAWAVVRSLATDLHFDDAHEAGVMPRAGSIERAATELSEEERAELVKLIEDEMKRIGA